MTMLLVIIGYALTLLMAYGFGKSSKRIVLDEMYAQGFIDAHRALKENNKSNE